MVTLVRQDHPDRGRRNDDVERWYATPDGRFEAHWEAYLLSENEHGGPTLPNEARRQHRYPAYILTDTTTGRKAYGLRNLDEVRGAIHAWLSEVTVPCAACDGKGRVKKKWAPKWQEHPCMTCDGKGTKTFASQEEADAQGGRP